MDANAVARRLVLSLTFLATAGPLAPSLGLADGGPPPLTGPEGSAPEAPAPIPAPVDPKPAPSPAPPAREDRPVLALPGLTVPSNRNKPITAPLPPPSISSSADGGLPPLEMPGDKPASRSTPELMPLPSDRFRGNVIESVPVDGIPPITAPSIPRSGTSTIIPGRSRVNSSLNGTTLPSRTRTMRDEFDNLDPKPLGSDKDLLDEELSKEKLEKLKEKEKKTEAMAPPPRRGFPLFNRWMPRPAAEPENNSGIKVEPRTDPAADAAIKRRIERQANDAVGDRTKSIDVRVVGRSVTIQARGVKFLQRRTVRRSLESLPGLSGYRSVVEVLD